MNVTQPAVAFSTLAGGDTFIRMDVIPATVFQKVVPAAPLTVNFQVLMTNLVTGQIIPESGDGTNFMVVPVPYNATPAV